MIKRSKVQWLSLFQQHEESGLTASQFCKDNNLCPKYFSQRKRQLGYWQSTSKQEVGFVKAVAPSVKTAPGQGAIQLRLAHCELHLPLSVSELWLANFIKALHA